jgi:hypothetical protein
MALVSTQSLREMSIRNNSLVLRWPVRRADNLTNIKVPSGSPQACTRIDLPNTNS